MRGMVLLSPHAFSMAFWGKRKKCIWWTLCSYGYSLQYRQRRESDAQLFFCGFLFSLLAAGTWCVREKTTPRLSWDTMLLNVGVEPDWWVVVLVRCLHLCGRFMCHHRGRLAHTLWGNNPYFILFFLGCWGCGSECLWLGDCLVVWSYLFILLLASVSLLHCAVWSTVKAISFQEQNSTRF